MGKFKDLTGERFGRLIAISAEKDTQGRRYVWNCKCDCGNFVKAKSADLTTGKKKSCGCIQKEILRNRNLKHGHSGERLYSVWKGMVGRCYNPNHTSYYRYGGRGIGVCADWKNDYESFRKWAIKNGYDENAKYGDCTLDRENVNEDYSPENCRWVDEFAQANNTRYNHVLEYNGESLTVAQWSRKLGISVYVIYARVNYLGWSVEKALSTPTRACKKRK